MIFRDLDPARDRDAVRRIIYEVGWQEPGHEELTDMWVAAGKARVAEIDGEAECLVSTAPGSIRYLEEDLPLCCVTGVTTSRIARKQGLAGRLTASLIAADAADGALVAGLGMFDQGFYNRIGFGTGSYELWAKFDPAQLAVSSASRTPKRITPDDWQAAHAARLVRRRGHGGCNVLPPHFTRAEMKGAKNGFGLGYKHESGAITHYLWCSTDDVGSGPYHVSWMAYQTPEQFLELMAVLHSLGDQVRSVEMQEPPGIQLQDLLRQPFRHRQMSERAKFENTIHAIAYWQMRLCDLPGCMTLTRLPGEAVRFNLRLSDPIETFLEASAPWRGVTGDYVVTLGPESSAERGEARGLPTLTASIGAFTRLWLGVRPATGLAVTDDLSGPPELLHRLDSVLRLPSPKPDWDF